MITNLNEIIFIDNLPTIDLHGFDRETARVATNDFVKDNIKLKKPCLVIIHGIGTGVLKEAVHTALKHDNNVLEYKLYNFNSGCTLVRIKI